MSTELAKDPITAAEQLALLEEKDKDETRCSYPTCYELRQVTTGTGRPSAYCANPKHTAVSNHRARQHLQKLVSGTPEAAPKRENVVPATGILNVESLRGSVVNEMRQLQGNLERYVATLIEITDPDISVAQLHATQDRAEARIAEAQQSVSAERSLRLAAEAASMVARKEAQAEREAAEQAIAAMEEAEAKTRRVETEAEQQIAAIQTERDATVQQVRLEAKHQIEDVETHTEEAIAQAQAATAAAQEEARLANSRAHDAETDARTRIAAAEQLVAEARTTLERERTEVDRLRKELTDARSHAESDRAEARTTLEHARADLERERGEVDRLRKELADAHSHAEQVTNRADQLATLTDELRAQLVQAQIMERDKIDQQ